MLKEKQRLPEDCSSVHSFSQGRPPHPPRHLTFRRTEALFALCRSVDFFPLMSLCELGLLSSGTKPSPPPGPRAVFPRRLLSVSLKFMTRLQKYSQDSWPACAVKQSSAIRSAGVAGSVLEAVLTDCWQAGKGQMNWPGGLL